MGSPKRPAGTPNERSFIFFITSRCNFRCPYCLRGPARPEDLPLEQYLDLLPQLKWIGYTGLSFTGGEPALHPKFPEMMDQAVRQGFRLGFVSNGSMLNRYRFLAKDFSKNVQYAAFSLDGSTADIHDKTRGPGSFRKVLSTIRYFVDSGIYTKILMSLSQSNQHDIERMADLASTLGVQSLLFLTMISTPQNKRFVLNHTEKLDCNKRIRRLGYDKPDVPVFTSSSLFTSGGVNFCPDLNGRGLTVNPNGKLIFCCDTIGDGAVLGSLRDSPLIDLFGRAYALSRKLKQTRKRILQRKIIPEGFDTCEFCNFALSRLIRFRSIPHRGRSRNETILRKAARS